MTPQKDPTLPPWTFALWPLRIALALVFIIEGVNKFSDMDMVTNAFAMWGIPAPQIMVPLVAFAELFGGIGLFFGVLPRFSAGALSIVILTALLAVRIPGSFGEARLDVLILAAMITILINGPGRPALATVLKRPWLDGESAIAAWWIQNRERSSTPTLQGPASEK